MRQPDENSASKTGSFASSDGAIPRGWLAFYLILALLTPLIYVCVTHHVWEDCLITLRHSQNLVEGKGLVYNPTNPQRVQGFTSVLNTMLLALFLLFCGDNATIAIDLYRGVCLAAFVIGGWMLLRTLLRDRGSDRLSPLIFILLYTTEAKTIAFTMNGQESAFMVAFLAIGFLAIYRGAGQAWLLSAISWTGLLYTRPDAPIFIAALGLTALAFRTESRRACLAGLVKSAVIAAIIFLPWFIWAWVYYGQPIPNTVLAKSNYGDANLLNPGFTIQMILRHYPTTAAWIFEPIYASAGGWPSVMDSYGLVCFAICTVYWLIPTSDRLGRMASLMFALTALYLAFIDLGALAYPWYLPSAAVFGTIVLSRSILILARRIDLLGSRATVIARLLQAAIVTGSLLLFIGQTIEIRVQQREIEDHGREQIGLYLKDVVKPDQKVYLEPIGYIGYYSNRYILDWPGLVTPTVVQLRHSLEAAGKPADRIAMIPALNPEWLVLRPSETQEAMNVPAIHDNYSIVKIFDANPRLAEYGDIPGHGYLAVDAVFYVLKRNDIQLSP